MYRCAGKAVLCVVLFSSSSKNGLKMKKSVEIEGERGKLPEVETRLLPGMMATPGIGRIS